MRFMTTFFLIVSALSLVFFLIFLVECSRPRRRSASKQRAKKPELARKSECSLLSRLRADVSLFTWSSRWPNSFPPTAARPRSFWPCCSLLRDCFVRSHKPAGLQECRPAELTKEYRQLWPSNWKRCKSESTSSSRNSSSEIRSRNQPRTERMAPAGSFSSGKRVAAIRFRELVL